MKYIVELPITYIMPQKEDDVYKGMSKELISDLGLEPEEEFEEGSVFIDLDDISIFNEGLRPNTTILRMKTDNDIWVINVSLKKFIEIYDEFSNVEIIKIKRNVEN
jgi:hypothetical protein